MNEENLPQYPEHEKLKAIAHLSQAQGEFMEWLREEKGIIMARRQNCEEGRDTQFYPDTTPIEQLLSEYHGINLQNLEDEKQAMLWLLRQPSYVSHS